MSSILTSAVLTSAVLTSAVLASTFGSSALTLSLAVPAGLSSDEATSSGVASSFDVSPSLTETLCSVAGSALLPVDVASDIVTGAFDAGKVLPASAVRVCSRNGAEAFGSSIAGLTLSPCPMVDLSSTAASVMAGLAFTSAAAALSAFAAMGASDFGSSAAIGCGTTFNAARSGCEKLAGVISPGVTTTRAPILGQFHIFMAKAMGRRMKPW